MRIALTELGVRLASSVPKSAVDFPNHDSEAVSSVRTTVELQEAFDLRDSA